VDMFAIKSTGVRRRKQRIVASTILNKSDFRRIASMLAAKPIQARKIGFIAARKAKRIERVDTLWYRKETHNLARPGDWIVTSLTARKKVLRDGRGNANTYVIKSKRFPKLYEPVEGQNTFGRFFRAKGVVDAIYFSGGFEIIGPWGRKESAGAGYVLLNGKEVYGNNAETFRTTYEIMK
jgi:hypothetical protein